MSSANRALVRRKSPRPPDVSYNSAHRWLPESNRLGQMGLADVPFTIQIRNRPCHFQHPLASAGGQAELLGDKGWKGMGDPRSRDPAGNFWPAPAAPDVCPRGHRKPRPPDRQSVGSRSADSFASSPRWPRSTQQRDPWGPVVRADWAKTVLCTYASPATFESSVSWRASERLRNDASAPAARSLHIDPRRLGPVDADPVPGAADE